MRSQGSIVLALLLAGCSGGREHLRGAPPVAVRYDQTGIASWYGAAFAGRPTASGERFDPGAMTAAHRTLPFGTLVEVSIPGRAVVVRINDRGPGRADRLIDLSQAAAARLGVLAMPTRVRVRTIR